jgi:hypothetical protein
MESGREGRRREAAPPGRQLVTTAAMRAPGADPTLADFQLHLKSASAGGIISCGGWNAEVQRALDAVRAAAPNPADQLLDAAMDAYLRQTTDPRPWYEQKECQSSN